MKDPLKYAQKLAGAEIVGRPLLRALCTKIDDLNNDLMSRDAIENGLRHSLSTIEQMAKRAKGENG